MRASSSEIAGQPQPWAAEAVDHSELAVQKSRANRNEKLLKNMFDAELAVQKSRANRNRRLHRPASIMS